MCASHGHMSVGYGMKVDALCGCGLSHHVMSHQSAEGNKLAMKKTKKKTYVRPKQHVMMLFGPKNGDRGRCIVIRMCHVKMAG